MAVPLASLQYSTACCRRPQPRMIQVSDASFLLGLSTPPLQPPYIHLATPVFHILSRVVSISRGSSYCGCHVDFCSFSHPCLSYMGGRRRKFFSYTSMDLLCEHGPARACAYPEIFTLP